MTERRTFLRRLLALCLCVLLLPGMAGAQGALKFRLRFHMDPAAFPERFQKTAEAAAELVNMLSVSGKALWRPEKNGTFRVSFNAAMDGDEATKNSYIVWGHEKHWGIRSSLLGEERVMINLLALTEFSLKAYYHLELPLQRLTLLLPYATKLGLQKPRSVFRKGFKGEGSRSYTRAECLEILANVAEAADNDSYFRLWATAVGVESGYDAVIRSAMAELPAWADSVLAEDGLRITVEEDREIWETGGTILYEGNADHFICTLPQGDGPFALSISWDDSTEEGLRSLQGTLALTADGEDLYTAAIRADRLPTGWDTDTDFTVALDTAGDLALPDTHQRLTGSLHDKKLEIVWPDSATGAPRLPFCRVCTPHRLPVFSPYPIAWDGRLCAADFLF